MAKGLLMGMNNLEGRAPKSGTDLADLPVRVDRETAAKLLTRFYFRTHRRTLERWPVRWQILNGRAHCLTAELFAVAEAKLADAPPIAGGRDAASSQ